MEIKIRRTLKEINVYVIFIERSWTQRNISRITFFDRLFSGRENVEQFSCGLNNVFAIG